MTAPTTVNRPAGGYNTPIEPDSDGIMVWHYAIEMTTLCGIVVPDHHLCPQDRYTRRPTYPQCRTCAAEWTRRSFPTGAPGQRPPGFGPER
jgi:hypothetical protein